MTLRIDPRALLATARDLRQHAHGLRAAPLPCEPDVAADRAREVAAAVGADLTDLADRLTDLVAAVSRQEETVAADWGRVSRRFLT